MHQGKAEHGSGDINPGDRINRQYLLVSRVSALALRSNSKLLTTTMQITSPLPSVTGTCPPFCISFFNGSFGSSQIQMAYLGV